MKCMVRDILVYVREYHVASWNIDEKLVWELLCIISVACDDSAGCHQSSHDPARATVWESDDKLSICMWYREWRMSLAGFVLRPKSHYCHILSEVYAVPRRLPSPEADIGVGL
ncbi:hypothetical protein CBL_10403 [Carabus blaptoides fortunei]